MKLAAVPTVTVVDTGWVVMEGPGLTVSVASELVTVPAALVMRTENFAPSSAAVSTGVV